MGRWQELGVKKGRQGGYLPEKRKNITQRLYMKTFMKTSVVAALALTLAAFGTSNARARSWPIAAGVVGGLAVGATVAIASAPVYAYPAYPTRLTGLTYPAYAAPVVHLVAPPPVYYSSPVVYAASYPYVYPCVRFGWSRGWDRGYSRHFVYRRR